MPTAPHKRNNRFYNNAEERIRTRLLDVAKTSWHALMRRMKSKRPSFISHHENINEWVEKPDFTTAQGNTSVTWLGHSTCLITIENITILTDPIKGSIGKSFNRNLPLPLPFNDLPHIDVILISHNHYDHLDIPTIESLKRFNPLIFVPMGDAHLLRSLGFHRVHECMWHESIQLETNQEAKKVEIIFLPAVHWSGRTVLDLNKSLWGSWLVRTKKIALYFAGDSAYGQHFSNIAHRYGPPEVALMPIGPEEPRELMALSHIGVEQALQAFDDLAATHFIPIHWGTFATGQDSFSDPIEKLKSLWPSKERSKKQLHVVPAGRVVVPRDV